MADTVPNREGGRVRTVQFNGLNFDTFNYSVRIALRRSNLIPIIEGTRLKPPPILSNAVPPVVTNQAEIDKWDQDDNLAMHYLFDSCNQEQQCPLAMLLYII